MQNYAVPGALAHLATNTADMTSARHDRSEFAQGNVNFAHAAALSAKIATYMVQDRSLLRLGANIADKRHTSKVVDMICD